jgi:UDP-N-acetylmuramate dehydrogenase
LKIYKNHDLSRYNTFGLGVKSAYFLEVEQEDDLPRAIETADELTQGNFMFLGGGSNVLFCGDYKGAVIHLAFGGLEFHETGRNQILVEAGAGVSWHDLVTYTTQNGWWGLENLALIPGSVGAAPIQNIGAYGVEQGDCFESLSGIPLNGPPCTYSKKICDFGYRNSIFKQELKNDFVITRVRYLLETQPNPRLDYHDLKLRFAEAFGKGTGHQPSSNEIANAVADIRRSKLPDPALIGNAGSFFKNPILTKEQAESLKNLHPNMPLFAPKTENDTGSESKTSAAWLIEQCGWKGHRRGAVGVSETHALVLVHYGDGKGEDLWQLAQDIRSSVRMEFGIDLEPEVNPVL